MKKTLGMEKGTYSYLWQKVLHQSRYPNMKALGLGYRGAKSKKSISCGCERFSETSERKPTFCECYTFEQIRAAFSL
jgi:hypothetical protein